MYAQIIFWNSYFRDFPSTEEPWGQAIWGLPAASGWPSFASPKCKVLSNLGWSRESCHYQPFLELLEGFSVWGFLQGSNPVLGRTAHTSEYAWCWMGLCPLVLPGYFSLTSSLLCFGRPAVIFIEVAQIHTEYTENIHFNFSFQFAL